MMSQPPPLTERFEPRGDRLWIAYDYSGNRTDSIYCPYRVGNHIPDEVVDIQAVKISSRWYWEVHLKKPI